MSGDSRPRLYATIKATPELHEAYDTPDKREAFALLKLYTQKLLREEPYARLSTPALLQSFDVVGAPSKDWRAAFTRDGDDPELARAARPSDAPVPDDLIVVYVFDSSDMLQQFAAVARRGQTLIDDAPLTATGIDLGFGSADHWCPGTDSRDDFSTRASANHVVAADVLAAAGHRGQRVNVVIIDQGLHQGSLNPGNWGGGLVALTKVPGTAPRNSHGMMVARSILGLAPEAVLYDVPLVPDERIASIEPFLSDAQSAFVSLLLAIWLRRPRPQYSGPWILVNAWAIFDRSSEVVDPGSYTENIHAPFDHPMIGLVKLFTDVMKLDVVFAAGNCGDFCASPRCGKRDRGPGRSIWGANALPQVITAGAVSCAETWIGASSQGPGPGTNGLALRKPDLCAPSHFREIYDAGLLNSGTSTACGMTAGVVAALRSNPAWRQSLVPPNQMLAALIAGARKTPAGWSERLGHGVLDADATSQQLP